MHLYKLKRKMQENGRGLAAYLRGDEVMELVSEGYLFRAEDKEIARLNAKSGNCLPRWWYFFAPKHD